MSRAVQLQRWVSLLLAGLIWTAAAIPGRSAEAARMPDEAQGAAPKIPLTRVAEVKSWSDLAGQSLAVELEGVVTCAAPAGNFFLHDGEMGIHVAQSEAGRYLKPGDRVRVFGTTRRGAYAPSIEPRELVSTGKGPLPPVQRVSYDELASGTLDGQFVEVDGVVCDVTVDPSTQVPILDVATGGRRLRVTVYGDARVDAEALIDAEVRLRGPASGSFNRQRQLVEPVVRLAGSSFLTVLRAPPADPFAAPLVPLTRLLGFSLDGRGSHRVRIAGTVTRRAGERTLFIRGENLGLRVETRAAVNLARGDRIEVVGFAAMSRGAAALESAVVRVLQSGPAPPPVRAEAAELLDGLHTADLVSVRARLVDWVATEDSATLILQSGELLFRATLQHPGARAAMPERGSVVDLTGICTLSEPDAATPRNSSSIGLLLAEPSDIVVVRRAAWWTSERLWRALAIVTVLLLAGLGWVWSLRRQIRRKRSIIEEQARHAAVLEERSRIARDLHDTIEQGLTGLSLQLKVVEMDCKEAPQDVPQGIETARQMLRQSRALAHNAIRELRTDEVAHARESLAAALERNAGIWRQSGIVEIVVAVSGREVSLPSVVERHLINMAAEALTNAVKHGHATSIEVALNYGEIIRLEVRDNGAGFDPSSAAAACEGARFGLVGMRERAQAIGARLDIQSTPGVGTNIVVELPAAGADCGNTALREKSGRAVTRRA